MSPTSASLAKNVYRQSVEIDAGAWVSAVTFTKDGEYVIGGGDGGVQLWRAKDGERVATLQVPDWRVLCVAVSKSGRYIAAGLKDGQVLVWDATTYKQVLAHGGIEHAIWDVDFSPDPRQTRLVSADSGNYTATVWDIATHGMQRLRHGSSVRAAKYSPQGDRIATATWESIHIRDSNNGRLLLNIRVGLEPEHGLVWSHNDLFVKTDDNRIKQINASSGSTVSKWSVPSSSYLSCIALPQHGKFIAYSAKDSIAFWDTSTHTRLGLIPYDSHGECPIAFSPNDHLAIAACQNKKIIIHSPSFITEPEIRIESAALNAWKDGQLADAEVLLTAEIPTSKDTAHDILAGRALVCARLQQWDSALVDAEESIEIQPSVIGYIAKCVALIGKGNTDAGRRVCDIAMHHFHSDHVTLLLLVKAVALFMAGQHDDAISRIDDLIRAAYFESALYIVQTYMHLHLGNLHMKNGNYEHAIQSFEDARAKLGSRTRPPPSIVSLISGWNFDDLAVTIKQQSCEAFFAAGCMKEAGESVLCMVDEETNLTKSVNMWISDFMQKCLSTPNGNADHASAPDDSVPIPQEILHVPHTRMPLLEGWARAKLTTVSWKDALDTATSFTLPRFVIHQVLCKRLETTGHVEDAVACVNQMCSELAYEMEGEHADRTQAFRSWCCKKLEDFGDHALNTMRYDTAILQYTAALSLNPAVPQCLLVKRSRTRVGKGEWDSAFGDANEVIKLDPSSPFPIELLKEWTNLKLTTSLWKDVLTATDTLVFTFPKLTIYEVICHCLEAAGNLTDAVACFRHMCTDLAEEMESVQVDWTRDFKSRFCEKLECLGDEAMNASKYDEAILQYTAALSVAPATPQDLLIKRSEAHAAKDMWEDAFSDADEVVKLDPYSLLPMQLFRDWAKLKLMTTSWDGVLVSAGNFAFSKLVIYEVICECLEFSGRVIDAVICFHHMCSELTQGIDTKQPDWTRDFKSRCCEKLEDLGDNAMSAGKYDEAISQYTASLSVEPTAPQNLLVKRSKARAAKGMWEDAFNDANEVAKMDSRSLLPMQLLKEWTDLTLMTDPWKDALVSAGSFAFPRLTIYEVVCECLESAGNVVNAVACFHSMCDELPQAMDGEQTSWIQDFRSRCREELEDLGDNAMNANEYDEAISNFTVALSLSPATPQNLLVKRSKAHLGNGVWEDVFTDMNELTKLDPSSPLPIQLLREWANSSLTTTMWKEALVVAGSFMFPKSTIYQIICERLETTGHVMDAVACFQHMCSEPEIDGEEMNWAQDLKSRCSRELEDLGDSAMHADEYDEALLHYTAALSVRPATPKDLLVKRGSAYGAKTMWEAAFSDMNEAIRLDPDSPLPMPLLRDWAGVRLTTGTWGDALATTGSFTLLRFAVYQVICERLEVTGHVTGAVVCYHQMCRELSQDIISKRANWTRDLKLRCCGKLERLGDVALDARQYDRAIAHYTAALSVEPVTPQDLVIKRSKARVGNGMWEDALSDANEAINIDPSSPLGYERQQAALHGTGRHHDALRAFETMLFKMSQSPNQSIRELSRRYIRPEKTKDQIHTIIEDTIHDAPPVLIDTTSGRLCNKSEQASAFEKTPTFAELILSMTTHLDKARIEREVEEYFRYATFSHKWEDDEPLFEKVINIMVYDLEASPTHEKLQMFCKIVREAGFNWAWSDTCCINKSNHFVLQEALVSMFKWYERSAMTLIFLRGVDRLAKRGALMGSIWNMRAWTLQEYHASKVVRFYTQDWTPYLGLKLYNHKDSPEIISEMEEATRISAHALMSLHPGLDDIREKLRLASTRQTTRIEDAAYSLLGIFSVSLPVVYGEGDKALGRLLAQVLTSSGDMSILAWTGKSNTFNSCLPARISVFSQLPTTHIPPNITDDEVQRDLPELRFLDFSLVTMLCDRVNYLPVPSFTGRRMKLPCLTFKLGPVSFTQTRSGYVFRAQTNALGIVEIRTKEDLSQLGALYLVHPWIDFLLDRQPIGSVTTTTIDDDTDENGVLVDLPPFLDPSSIPPMTQQTRRARLMSRISRSFGSHAEALDTASLLPPSTLSPMEKHIRVLQFFARLKKPFGALLLTPTRRNVEEYRRVSAESLIRVQVQGITPAVLDKLINSVRMLDVL